MSVTILYFASLREALGRSEEHFDLPPGVVTVGALRESLCARGGDWTALAPGKAVRAAVNQELAQAGAAIKDGDEIAFFPPVTGG
ncbi:MULTISPECIES: molybdopterin converting factor subunit 1 [unclassified Uliginosibacterium]|uniref:molybdopterin converting factor subunit 1 n=1 Tax=unclassified Uliginosibacterium TaxID=2621521 RepID=UPI000C7D9187|nr:MULTISPECIES: molybdopterin converting factor subunit 1 [unclassified Uliginosibacterium]MDO6384760.1 molybdopterin converting factor subunit 1 [Uliginosibacterium sp. 31-12]PLK48452.1 molybdopterin converting factor subunit 1 [Uliginosibacterium sp. TH139]